MITKRDKKILIWIEKYCSITINQCSKIFFTGNKQAYDQARKRLRYLNKEGLIKRYRKDPRSEVIYYMDKKLKIHDLKLMDFVAEFYAQGWELHKFDKEFTVKVKDKKYIIDGKAVFKKGKISLPAIIEIDYSHMTAIKKINDIANVCKGKYLKIFFVVRVAQEKIKIKKTENDSVCLIYLPWGLEELKEVLSQIVGQD